MTRSGGPRNGAGSWENRWRNQPIRRGDGAVSGCNRGGGGGAGRAAGKRLRDEDRAAGETGQSGDGVRERLRATLEFAAAHQRRAVDGVCVWGLGLLRAEEVPVVHRGDGAGGIRRGGAGAKS